MSVDSGGECNVPHTYRYYTPAQTLSPQRQQQHQQQQQEQQPQQQQRRRLRHVPTSKPSGALSRFRSTISGGFTTRSQSDVGFESLDPHRSYYSFGMGKVFILMLDSEMPSHPGSPQGQFVAAELAKVG